MFVQILSWTNAYIRVEKLKLLEMQLHELYQWWSIFPTASKQTNLNMESDCAAKIQDDVSTVQSPQKERLSFITQNFKIYSAVNRGNIGGSTSYNPQPGHIYEFESLIFREVQPSFVISDYQLGTIDDEIFGYCAHNLQVKKLNDRMVLHGKGWGADVVADPLTCLPLAAWQLCLDGTQASNVCSILDTMMVKHISITKSLLLFGADCGYASHQLIQDGAKCGIGIVLLPQMTISWTPILLSLNLSLLVQRRSIFQ